MYVAWLVLYFSLFSTEKALNTSPKSKTKDKNEQATSIQGEETLQSLPRYDLVTIVDVLSYQEHSWSANAENK